MDLNDADALQHELSALEVHIVQRTEDLIEQALPTPPPEPAATSAPDPSEDLELVNTLWILKAGFQEAESLIELEDFEAASHSLSRLDGKVSDFNAAFPHTLLGVDITRQAENLRTRLRKLVNVCWGQLVTVTDSKVEFGSHERGDEIVTLYPHKDAELAAIGALLDRILDLSVAEVNTNHGLELVDGPISSLTDLAREVSTAITYLASAPPETLARAISRRYKSHLVGGILRRSIPKLYPSDTSALPAFKQQLQAIVELESVLSSHGWAQGADLSQFVTSFDQQWPTIRRGQYLARLRQLYKDVAPITTVESRRKLVKLPSEGPADEWEWNDEDAAEDGTSSDGSIVELWTEYVRELGEEHVEQFLTLYRAIVPTVYGAKSLWLYADTLAFIKQAGDKARDALSPFAYLYLHSYVQNQAAILESDFLPHIFGNKQNKALSQLKSHIGAIAEESNAEGGPELRETVLGQLLEQTAVYVINSVEALDDIGDEESTKMASVIAKLENFGVFFRDVKLAVPSWYKLEMLERILMGNLASIRDMHAEHLLADYSAIELRGLLEALFVDSAARQSLIRDIQDAENL